MNPLRIRILTEIDVRGFSLAGRDELAESFRHAQHWANWAAKWHLDVDPSDDDIAFTRQPKTITS